MGSVRAARKEDEMTSIYGQAAVVAVVEGFYERVLADEQLAGFFAGVAMPRVKGKQVEFFCAALGGPEPYCGRSMREVHRGRGIGQVHFDLVVKHLGEALAAAGVPDPTVGSILAAIAPLQNDIVSSRA
jgi:hemoglobin